LFSFAYVKVASVSFVRFSCAASQPNSPDPLWFFHIQPPGMLLSLYSAHRPLETL
jgi:hypothetical protein